MITISKGKDTKIVTKGAYEQFFKPLGYTTVEKKAEVKEAKVTEEIKEEVKEAVIETAPEQPSKDSKDIKSVKNSSRR